MSTRPPDPDGLRYLEHWEPVLAAPAHRLLERVAGLAAGLPAAGDGTPLTLLDVGAGAGSLALAAAERWPGARIVGLDASAGMLSVARHRVTQRWPEDETGRFEWHAADATAMPLPDASVDVVVSSFVLQLLPDRTAALRESFRVLRPGGVLGLVTWLADDELLLPDLEFDEAVYDLALEDPETGAGPREHDAADYASLAEAHAELEAAGFADVDVQADRLEYTWGRQAYRLFKERYDEHELFGSLTATDRARLSRRVEERWAALPDEAFALRAEVVSATARRPAAAHPAAVESPQAAKGVASSGRQMRQGR